MMCLQKAFCESNRIQTIGTWNNDLNFGNNFSDNTAREISNINPNYHLV